MRFLLFILSFDFLTIGSSKFEMEKSVFCDRSASNGAYCELRWWKQNDGNIRVNNYALHLMDVSEAHLIIFVGVSDARDTVTCLYGSVLLASKLMIVALLWKNSEVKWWQVCYLQFSLCFFSDQMIWLLFFKWRFVEKSWVLETLIVILLYILVLWICIADDQCISMWITLLKCY